MSHIRFTNSNLKAGVSTSYTDNEDEYTFFAWERGDVSAFSLDFASLPSKLEPQYGSDTKQIIETYR